MSGVELGVWRDVAEHFRFMEDALQYVDGPVEGFLEQLGSGERYAFRCRVVVKHALWHWVLLPAPREPATVEQIFSGAETTPPQEWISLLEDRRTDPPRVAAVELLSAFHPPPLRWSCLEAQHGT